MGALSNSEAAEIIEREYVSTYEQVGRFLVSTEKSNSHYRGRRDYLAKRGGDVVTYFCTPQGEVIHFLVGPAAAATLAEEAAWAADAYRQVSADGFDQQRRNSTMRRLHLARYLAAAPRNNAWQSQLSEEQWEQHLAMRRKQLLGDDGEVEAGEDPEHSRDVEEKLEHLIRRAKAGGMQRWTPAGHLILAELPLPLLPQVEQAVFEGLAGQPFARRSARSDELRARLQATLVGRRASLLIVTTERRADDRATSSEVLQHRRLIDLEDQFDPVVLTQLELTTLMDDIDLPPPPSYSGRQFKYVVLGANNNIFWRDRRAGGDVLAKLIVEVNKQAQPSSASSEEVAARKFALAVNLLQANREAAARRLREIVEHHAGTKTAARAGQFLARLE